MKPKIKYPKLDPKKNPELNALTYLVGDFIEYWGFKSVQGRMWCYLYLIKEPLNSRQLSQLLKISPALVTQSVQVLLEFRVIIEAPKGRNGVLRFQANPNVAEAISTVLSQRERVLLGKIQSAQKDLEKSSDKTNRGKDLDLNRERVRQVGQWIALAKLFLETGLSSLGDPENNPFDQPEAYHSLAKYLPSVRAYKEL